MIDKKNKINLSPRLKLCAEFVPESCNFLDIGTDHAYLPISLLQEGKIKKALACDINAEPLNLAKANATKHCVALDTRLSNGFETIDENEFDCATIAGMGGDLIGAILKNCTYIKSKTLILQPMSKAYKLREFLFANGFYIEKEQAIMDKGKIYSVMLVKQGKSNNTCVYMGQIKPQSNFSKEYALSVISNLKNMLKSAENSELQNKINEIERGFLDEKH